MKHSYLAKRLRDLRGGKIVNLAPQEIDEMLTEAADALDGPHGHRIDELRCSLSTIAGLAASKGANALHEIACTALAGLARIKAMDHSPSATHAGPK